MNKTKIIFIIASLVAALSVSGQIRIGAKGGVNVAHATFSKDVFNADNLTGFHIGPAMEFMLGDHGLGFDAAVLYTQKSFKVEGEAFKNAYLQVPVNLKYKFCLTGIKPYLAAGPYIDLKIAGKDTWESAKEQIKSKDFSAGLNFSAGVELIRMIQIGINLDWGLADHYSSFHANDPESYRGKSVTWSGCVIVWL